MSKSFPLVPIGEVAFSVERPEAPLPGTVYRQVGVHLWGEGAYERKSIDGGETKSLSVNKYYLSKSDQGTC